MITNFGRINSNFNQGWRFLLGDDRDSYKTSYDDCVWEKVSLPHAVKLSQANASGGRNYQGICRYRKHFLIPEEYKGKKVFIQFEGAMSVCEVWVNDCVLPVHYGGYLPFMYDITEYLNFGVEENLLAIRLDNSDNENVPPGKPQSDLDFTYEGGLYRNVGG